MTTDHLPAVADGGVSFLPPESESSRVWRLATRIADTEFVPSSLRRKPEAILAAMLTGREVGIGAMHSLRAIDVIDGRPSLSPELLHAMALKAGHDVDVEESTREGCTVAIHRRDWPADRVRRVTFDETDARIAGLVGDGCRPAEGHHVNDRTTQRGNPTCGCKQGYRTYPRAMYRARAVAEACRTYLSDVSERTGYTVEELGGDPVPHDDALQVVRDVAPDQADAVAAAYDDEDDVEDAVVVEDGPDDEDGTPAVVDDTPPDDDDPFDGLDEPEADPVEEAVTDARTPGAAAARSDAATPQAGTPADVPAPRRQAVYDTLNVGQVSELVRDGTVVVDLDGGPSRLSATPHEVWTWEQARDGAFRKTVKGTLESVGYANSATKEVADDAPEAHQDGPSAPEALPLEVADPAPATDGSGAQDASGDKATQAREWLRTYKRLYRETYEADQGQAGRMHAARLKAVGDGEDTTWLTTSPDVLRTLMAEVHAIHTAAAVPF